MNPQIVGTFSYITKKQAPADWQVLMFFGKAEQYRCKYFLVIFQLRWSDIFDKSKVLLKPSVSVILYLFLKLAVGEYHCPKGNITYEVNITCSARNKYN